MNKETFFTKLDKKVQSHIEKHTGISCLIVTVSAAALFFGLMYLETNSKSKKYYKTYIELKGGQLPFEEWKRIMIYEIRVGEEQ